MKRRLTCRCAVRLEPSRFSGMPSISYEIPSKVIRESLSIAPPGHADVVKRRASYVVTVPFAAISPEPRRRKLHFRGTGFPVLVKVLPCAVVV